MTARKKELESSWARTRAHLEDAHAQLPESAVGDEKDGPAQQYCDWLHHNELELALDELERLGEESSVRSDFWEALVRAATEMNLNDRALRYLEKQAR